MSQVPDKEPYSREIHQFKTTPSMNPIRIDNYCFDRIHLWVRYDKDRIGFTELALEVFYPADRKANGLLMFNHGFLIGDDLLYLPKKLLCTFFNNDCPLFQKNPSEYYNYTSAIVERNWAFACVTACHKENEVMPWTDFGGNPRVGQEAYTAASYLIRYGATNMFHNESAVDKARFMVNNRVVFAGHSVGGAHAQAAATGFVNLQAIGEATGVRYNPVVYDREILPYHTEPLASWPEEYLADLVGLVQLSPVDMTQKALNFGMAPYRNALSTIPMPILMIIGQCDCAARKDSTPPAWSPDDQVETQFTEEAPSDGDSWAVVANVERGSHCGYLTRKNLLCTQADNASCGLCDADKGYKADGDETRFTVELFRRFLALFPDEGGFDGDFCQWIESPFMTWLNNASPDGSVSLVPFGGGDDYIDYTGKDRCA
ncbi:conserved hypothetical protein [Prosthecochloris aestuarii DSM 271]|uniref:Uncharacterized protein n=2 Tax=Prosthecochloris aestuarii TaxID=1102 RepID=B4S7F9_PROA2|nr:conserved hypothetical protein [Prosthecochloris aestuarii DSM 271]